MRGVHNSLASAMLNHDQVDLPTTPIDEKTRPNRVELTPLTFLERAACAFGARPAPGHREHHYTYHPPYARTGPSASTTPAAPPGSPKASSIRTGAPI